MWYPVVCWGRVPSNAPTYVSSGLAIAVSTAPDSLPNTEPPQGKFRLNAAAWPVDCPEVIEVPI
ncbi:hypothetical protein GCM10011507_25730 [Edaphobacter acidisoli]|uniref:Uncharacterized protein n=1 Tax=Edaphobacter acidisoli TaxID=2040573 RepID=A0A916RVS0_9BACT|nr:hypothetical protein GCM10011507_25730 [Edaphobacter acidisoli]